MGAGAERALCHDRDLSADASSTARRTAAASARPNAKRAWSRVGFGPTTSGVSAATVRDAASGAAVIGVAVAGGGAATSNTWSSDASTPPPSSTFAVKVYVPGGVRGPTDFRVVCVKVAPAGRVPANEA